MKRFLALISATILLFSLCIVPAAAEIGEMHEAFMAIMEGSER